MEGMEGISDTQRVLELQFTQSFTTGNLIIDTLIKGKTGINVWVDITISRLTINSYVVKRP